MINQKLAICIIGAGRAGMIHGKNFSHGIQEATLAAIVDPDREAGMNAACQLGVPQYYSDYRDALADDRIDAYVVVSPTECHRQTVVDIARCGKHILCEKPMGMTEEDCDEMINATKDSNVILQIGFMRRFDEAFLEAKRMIDWGEIGDVVMVRSNTRGPSVPKEWMYDLKKSNGPLAEVNSHDIDTMRWFTGSEFEKVYALGGNYRCPDAREKYPDFYDNVVLTASFENGMQGILDGAQGVGYGYDARVEVVGTRGCINLGDVQGEKIVMYSSEIKKGIYPLTKSWKNLFAEAYRKEDEEFVACVLEGREPSVTGWDGKMAVRVVEAGNQSIKTKQVVELKKSEGNP